MRAVLKALDLEPDPTTLPADPESFAVLARMIIGRPDSPGEESFDATVCSPEWLAARCREVGIYDARHHLVVAMDQFDRRLLRNWLEKRVSSVQAETWRELGEKLGHLGHWEFEDYKDQDS